MKRLFYPRLAATNIRKNARTYFPYILTCIGTVMMFYIITALSQNSGLQKMPGADILGSILVLGSTVVGFFSVIFLFYTNSFLIKRRKKEFGLFNILGMEKKHIARVMILETLCVALLSLVLGLLGGMLFSKLIFLILLKILNFSVPLGFEISVPAIYSTLILFGAIFLLTLLNNLRQIHLSKPIELLKGGQTGEKEPKTKWVMTLVGLLTLGAGYYIALTTKDPLSAILLFFVAVILVIIGTYCLFIAGSIAILKLLRKNKGYYYRPRHFTTVSGMLYRMKQNAAGLANICILSTAVLVMLSTTVSLYIGMEDLLQGRYPRDITVTSYEATDEAAAAMDKAVENALSAHAVSASNTLRYRFLSFAALEKGSEFITAQPDLGSTSMSDAAQLRNLCFIPVEDFNRTAGQNKELADNEVLLYSDRQKLGADSFQLFGRNFTVKERIEDFDALGFITAQTVSTHYIIVKDMGVIDALYQEQAVVYGEDCSEIRQYYGFDMDTSDDIRVAVYNDIKSALNAQEFRGYTEGRAAEKDGFYSLYGGLFFLGLFLGILFIMATVLIIYYKQISEGYDDKERFEIMQKVGMSHAEVKKTIHSQVLTVFFLPLLVACIHIAFAFPFITRILAVFSLTNILLFTLCTLGTILLFALLYALVYALTARSYYRIVSA